ncbi:MAG: 23S rRNA (uracil-5-)-methyltransferase RumA [Spirochaetes bacterium RBG_16_49_21]|nr:MAG: 23S rRNA (uracil-5-)-methyltransferase RumA [Spirochaetes bacterium RBG_16_49_21]
MKKRQHIYINRLMDAYRGEGAVPPCPLFGSCGGCLFQHIRYKDQLALKKEIVNDALRGVAAVDQVHPSEPYRYRGRMDLVVAFGKCGLRRRGNYRAVVDVTACSIMKEKSNSLLGKIRPFIEKIEGYDYLRHRGYLRYVVLRETSYTGRVMANFVVAERENRLAALLDGIAADADSISLIYSGGLADLSYGDIIENVRAGYIEEDFDGIRYRITPNSFFQSNAEAALRIYRRIREEARGRVLDLCAGVGSISLFIAEASEHVTGVEKSTEAVENANMNKELNRIGNADFICSDAKDFVRDAGGNYETIILDPPRSGLQRSVMEHIDRMGAGKIIYMSCNPASFRDDVQFLQRYTLESIEAYDMFGQTPHVELLGVLKRKI